MDNDSILPDTAGRGGRMDLMARSYDRYGRLIVPHYDLVQYMMLDELSAGRVPASLVVDLGAGSGILLQRICQRYPSAVVVWIDRSEGMLAVAQERLAPYAGRVTYNLTPLQEDWAAELPGQPSHIVSMSALHHLDDADKQALYDQCYAVLAPGGRFWNADEVMLGGSGEYAQALRQWDEYVSDLIRRGQVDGTIARIWEAWRRRNLNSPGPKRSGDDCHATVAAQLEMLRAAGFQDVESPWHKGLWALFGGSKP